MEDRSESVHVHWYDASHVIEQFRKKGFSLKEQTEPTVLAQKGFIKLIFVPEDEIETPVTLSPPAKPKKKFFFL